MRPGDWADDWCDELENLDLDGVDRTVFYRRVRIALRSARAAGVKGDALFAVPLPESDGVERK